MSSGCVNLYQQFGAEITSQHLYKEACVWACSNPNCTNHKFPETDHRVEQLIKQVHRSFSSFYAPYTPPPPTFIQGLLNLFCLWTSQTLAGQLLMQAKYKLTFNAYSSCGICQRLGRNLRLSLVVILSQGGGQRGVLPHNIVLEIFARIKYCISRSLILH